MDVSVRWEKVVGIIIVTEKSSLSIHELPRTVNQNVNGKDSVDFADSPLSGWVHKHMVVWIQKHFDISRLTNQ
jgi:hypothetical protein